MDFTGERFVPSLEEKQIKYEHLQRYHAIKHLVDGKTVLDAATGEGYGASILSETASQVYAIDIDRASIDRASRTYSKSNLAYLEASIERLPFPDLSMDVVVSFETIEHVGAELQSAFLKEIARVLKHDGLLIISTPNKAVYSDARSFNNPFHVKEFYKQEFVDFLKLYFPRVQLYHQKNEIISLLTDMSVQETLRHIALELNESNDEGTYLTAVCSRGEIRNASIGSAIVFPCEYQRMLQRIVELQEEVEERNQHIRNLDTHVEELSRIIQYYQSIEKQLTGELSTIRQEHEGLLSGRSELEQALKSFDEALKTLQQTLAAMEQDLQQSSDKCNEQEFALNCRMEEVTRLQTDRDRLKSESMNKEAHIQSLLVQERILHNIYASGGWKLLTKYYKIRDGLVPANSKRRLLVKLAKKTLANPRFMLQKLNHTNLKKLRYYMKVEENSNIENRIDNFLDRHESNRVSLDIKLTQLDDISEKLILPQFEEPLVSIIIPVYNQWSYTYACVASIMSNTSDTPYEVIIADDMSSDETVNISSYIENVRVIRDGTNRGFLQNCNNAAQYATGKYIFFLNNDTNVQPDWLGSLVRLIESDDGIGMVGSKLVYPDGKQQEAGGIIWKDASGWNYGRLDEPDKSEYNYVKEVDYISGAAIMIRRNLWERIGGFDARYVPAYFEDSDLAFEVRRHGYTVMLQPKSVVVHFEGISHGTDTGSGIKSYQVKNKEKFLEKWKDVLQAEHFPNAENVFLARDRSRNKKTILMVDHYVPHYDKDAGSKTVFQYISLFVQLGYNVKFIGDNFFRHEPYTNALEQMGVEVLYGNWYSKHYRNWLQNNGKYIDYVWLNRPHISFRYIDDIKKLTHAKIFYYGHDLHYMRELREYQLTNNPSLLQSAGEWKNTELELCKKADMVYYPSQNEIDELKGQLPGLQAKAIPAYIYGDKPYTSFNKEERDGLLFVGGFGHKPNTDAVLWFVNHVWPLLLKEAPDLRFYVVGSNPPDVILELQSSNIVVTGFVSDEELAQYYRRSRLVVVPLRYGAGVKGKVVEALYNHMPIVTTSIGAEGLPEIKSYLKVCDDQDEMATTILSLYFDDHELAALSKKGAEYINCYFSAKHVIQTIQKDFNVERI